MPRYFFHTRDGADIPMPKARTFPDVASARAQAITTAGQMLKDEGERLWGTTEWFMTVVNEAGRTVCALRFTAE